MATITKLQLENASQDADTLEIAINLDTDVVSRLGANYKSVPKIIREAQAAINQVMAGAVPDGGISDAKVAANAAIAGTKLKHQRSGTGAKVRTGQDKFNDYLTVTDYGATGVGTVSDVDYFGFQDTINSLPTVGGQINVPPGTYYLSNPPNQGGKSIYWNISPGCTFVGPGAVYGSFRSLTQIGNQPSGPWIVDRIKTPNLYSGQLECFNSFTAEAIIDDPATPRYSFTGNLSSNSNVISNVSNFTGLYLGAPIYDNLAGVVTNGGALPYGRDNSQPRISAMDTAAKTITMTLPYSGTAKTGVTLRSDFHQWKSAIFNGIRMNSKSRDTAGWAQNAVVEFSAGAEGVGYGYEIDVVMYGAGGKGIGRAFLASGHGDYDPDTAYESSYTGNQRWLYGAKLRKTHNGIKLEGDNTAIVMEQGYNRGLVDLAMVGEEFGSAHIGSSIAVKQLGNNADTVVIARNTDTAPTGTFLRFLNSAKNVDLFRVETNGNIFAGGLPTTKPDGIGYLWRDGSTNPPTLRIT